MILLSALLPHFKLPSRPIFSATRLRFTPNARPCCRLEPPSLGDSVSAALPRASAFSNVSIEKCLSRFESLMIAAFQEHGAVGGLHFMRGGLYEKHGNMTDALCDFQAAFARGAAW